MAGLKPQLVKAPDGKICVQLMLGQYSATLPLPDEMATWTGEQLQPFFDSVVPEMTKGLLEMRTKDNRKMRRKACGTSSIEPLPESEAKILHLPQQP